MTTLITPDLVALDADLGSSSHDVIGHLVDSVVAAGRADDPAGLLTDALAREGQAATGLPGGLGIPHCRSSHVLEPTLAFARLSPAADFGAPDGPADLVFLIAAPTGGDATHLKLLTALARALVKKDFVAALRAAPTKEEVVRLVGEAIEPKPASAPGAAAAGSAARADSEATPGPVSVPSAQRSIVAVTACPTGIAHTYMAADHLVAAGERAGVKVIVETQGSAGSIPLDPATIAAATAVVFATDVGVNGRERFAGKPVVASGVKRAINEPDVMIAEALSYAADPHAPRVEGAGAGAGASSGAGRVTGGSGGGDVHLGIKLRQWLLTGVSYMIPFVAAGGLLIALGFWLGGYDITESASKIVTQNSLLHLPAGGLSEYLGAVLFTLGSLAFSFLVPALAGYIAFAIADRPGIAPGFTVGLVCTSIGAGFLGGLVGGLLAGLAALWISRLRVPVWFRGLMPVVVIPLGATLIAGGIMVMLLGKPFAELSLNLTEWLNGLSGGSSFALGLLLGAMMAFDMGGPVNKAAYAFAVAGLSTATATNTVPLTIMAAVMAAGMVPPLALGAATFVRPRLFSEAERENGKAAIPLGAAFITEGAIPFAAADPLRVIPSISVASAVTGAIVMVSDVTLRAPHGGIFVFFAMTKVWVFVLALAIGTVIGAVAVIFAKTTFGPKEPADEANEIDLRAAEAAEAGADAPARTAGARPAHA